MESQNDRQFEPASTLHYFKKAVEVIKLNRRTMAEIAQDRNALRFGLAVTAIGGALALLPHTNFQGIVIGILYSLAVLFLFAGFVHLVAGHSKGKDNCMGFVRVVAVSGIIDWLALIPLAGLFATIWSFVVAVVAAEEVYGLTRSKAIFCVLLSGLALWLITLTLLAGPLGPLYETSWS